MDAWYEQTITMLPEWMAQDFRVMYECFQKFGCLAPIPDYTLQRQLLLREPRSFQD